MIDIQRLKGLPSVELETVKVEDYIFVELIRVIDALFTFATSSPEEEGKRLVEAINALTALCRLQEAKRPFHLTGSVRHRPLVEFCDPLLLITLLTASSSSSITALDKEILIWYGASIRVAFTSPLCLGDEWRHLGSTCHTNLPKAAVTGIEKLLVLLSSRSSACLPSLRTYN